MLQTGEMLAHYRQRKGVTYLYIIDIQCGTFPHFLYINQVKHDALRHYRQVKCETPVQNKQAKCDVLVHYRQMKCDIRCYKTLTQQNLSGHDLHINIIILNIYIDAKNIQHEHLSHTHTYRSLINSHKHYSYVSYHSSCINVIHDFMFLLR
ncbi:hypothetical protein LSH36_11g10061 [Paralvinella palmiformis]|uniref:Uncharacterized protein n=1 Tax=Paralvinella palmiformis TaxID=53620 RepID=A0AAD9KDN8_9ANNE|nr:hypothetical protein LSH36_11g10061 [Paralvinella palmiformis]